MHALLLQGGGALGSYQAGVYEALAEADLHPDPAVNAGRGNCGLMAILRSEFQPGSPAGLFFVL
jgi:predicted patatin/cPLA2 family phospholipase